MEFDYYRNIFLEEISLTKKLDQLIIDDLSRYLNILPNDDNFVPDEKLSYEGIYPHKLNIKDRLAFIFTFSNDDYSHYKLKIESKHIEQLYKLFQPVKFKKEMQILLNLLSQI